MCYEILYVKTEDVLLESTSRNSPIYKYKHVPIKCIAELNLLTNCSPFHLCVYCMVSCNLDRNILLKCAPCVKYTSHTPIYFHKDDNSILVRIIDDLKEPYRRMVMETVQETLLNLGAANVNDKLQERLINGILYAFKE